MPRTEAILAACAVALVAIGAPDPVTAQDTASAATAAPSDGANLTLEFDGGRLATLVVEDGMLTLDGQALTAVPPGVDEQWRAFREAMGQLGSDEALARVHEWIDGVIPDPQVRSRVRAQLDSLAHRQTLHEVAERALAEAAVAREVQARVRREMERYEEHLRGIESAQTTGSGRPTVHVGDLTIPRERTIGGSLIVIRGDLSVFGTVAGDVVALGGDVILHDGGTVRGDLVTLGGDLVREGGRILGQVRSERRGNAPAAPQAVTTEAELPTPVGLASLMTLFVSLAGIGFGLTHFMPHQLAGVSDTVSDSSLKSFVTGAFAQPLIAPALLLLILGLALTIVGIPVIPFALAGAVIALVVAGAGGYLAAATALGEHILSRRLARGDAVTITPYRSLIYGLLPLVGVWVPAALLGWIPLLAQFLTVLAALVTWVAVTAGVGATILARGGLRTTFVKPEQLRTLTDEFYWPSDTAAHEIVGRGR